MAIPDICSCCGEIWNRANLKLVPIGEHSLRLCPECYSELVKPLNIAKEEVKKLADILPKPKESPFIDGMRYCIEIIDKQIQ